jgi:hypothetical protein
MPGPSCAPVIVKRWPGNSTVPVTSATGTPYGTRLRQGGADVAQVPALLGRASVETSGRYFRGTTEQAAIVEAVFEQ